MCNAYNTLNNKLKITSYTTQQYWFLEYCLFNNFVRAPLLFSLAYTSIKVLPQPGKR